MSRVALVLALAAVTGCAANGPDPAVVSVMEQQVQAYNKRDLEAFLALFAEDAKIYRHPNELLLDGKPALRQAYGGLFANAPDLRADVHKRIVEGRFVIDQETTVGMPGKPDATGVAIYEIRNGLIVNVWFID